MKFSAPLLQHVLRAQGGLPHGIWDHGTYIPTSAAFNFRSTYLNTFDIFQLSIDTDILGTSRKLDRFVRVPFLNLLVCATLDTRVSRRSV